MCPYCFGLTTEQKFLQLFSLQFWKLTFSLSKLRQNRNLVEIGASYLPKVSGDKTPVPTVSNSSAGTAYTTNEHGYNYFLKHAMRSLHLHQYYCNYFKKPNKRADSTGTISEKWIMFKYDKSLPSFLKSIFLVIWHEISNYWSICIAKQNTEEFMPGSGGR